MREQAKRGFLGTLNPSMFDEDEEEEGMEAKKSFSVMVTMTREEALWLRAAMQNPFEAEENEETFNNRQELWTTLNAVLD